jgi:hypothetical protein
MTVSTKETVVKRQPEPQEYDPIQELRDLNTFDSTIPERIVQSSDSNPPPEMKVRKMWFTMVVGNIENAIKIHKITDQDLIDEATKVIDRFTSKDFKTRNTKKEDIDIASDFITRITEGL